MYVWTNKEKTESWQAIYSNCCKHKWTIEKWVKVNEKWECTDIYKRFDTLEDARQYAINDLQKIA